MRRGHAKKSIAWDNFSCCCSMLELHFSAQISRSKNCKMWDQQLKKWLHWNATYMLSIHLLLAWTWNHCFLEKIPSKHAHVWVTAVEAPTDGYAACWGLWPGPPWWPSLHHGMGQVFPTCASCAGLHVHDDSNLSADENPRSKLLTWQPLTLKNDCSDAKKWSSHERWCDPCS